MKPKTLTTDVLVNDRITITRQRLRYHNSHEADYYVVSSKAESVAIIALSPKGEILVTKEYRHPINDSVIGLPGGLVEDDETVIEAAKRELFEETGCQAASFTPLGSCYPLPGILAQKMTVILAKNATQTDSSNPELTESIQSEFLPLEKIRQLIREGQPIDGVLCTALYIYSQC